MMTALQQLSPDQREVLLLRMAAGLTAPEVAAALHKTTGAVKALQHRALATSPASCAAPATNTPIPRRRRDHLGVAPTCVPRHHSQPTAPSTSRPPTSTVHEGRSRIACGGSKGINRTAAARTSATAHSSADHRGTIPSAQWWANLRGQAHFPSTTCCASSLRKAFTRHGLGMPAQPRGGPPARDRRRPPAQRQAGHAEP
jgi:Sigma-70, region 4